MSDRKRMQTAHPKLLNPQEMKIIQQQQQQWDIKSFLSVDKIGDYILLNQIEGSSILIQALHTTTIQEFVCKVVPIEKHRDSLLGYFRLDGHDHVNRVEEVIVGLSRTYIFFRPSYGDLHSYVKTKKRLGEPETFHFFRQIAKVVADCHEAGLVLGDLKLRKFVFKDSAKTKLKLETLDNAVLLEEKNANGCDLLSDKCACPGYVSPEILSTLGSYSGRAADCWSLGIILYTMLVGRYPFHSNDPITLFANIRRGVFTIPSTLSSKARCLIRCLVRKEPSERLTANEVLDHPWLKLIHFEKEEVFPPFKPLTSSPHPSDTQVVPTYSNRVQ